MRSERTVRHCSSNIKIVNWLFLDWRLRLWDVSMILSERVIDPFRIIRELHREMWLQSFMKFAIRCLSDRRPTVSIVNRPIVASHIQIKIRIRTASRIDAGAWSQQEIFKLSLLYRRKSYRGCVAMSQNARVEALTFDWMEPLGVVQIHVIIFIWSWHLSLVSALHAWSESAFVGRIFDEPPSAIRFEYKVRSMNLIAVARFTVLLHIARCLIIHRIGEMIICFRWTDCIGWTIFSVNAPHD